MPGKNKDVLQEKIPPQSLEAEKALLGCMLISEEARIRVFEVLKESCLYSHNHQKIFFAIARLSERGERCDLITLANQLKQQGLLQGVGGIEYLTELVEFIPTAANVDDYVAIVKDKSVLRNLIANATRIISEALKEPENVDSLLDKSEALIFDVSQHNLENAISPISDLIRTSIEEIEKIQSKRGFVTGLPTGFTDLDALTTGFHPADFVVIASRPSMGKTALACNIALNMNSGINKVPVLIFSLEMSKAQLVHRLLCCEAKINNMKLRQGMLSDKDMGNILVTAGRLEEQPIFIDDTPSLTAFELRARARRLKAKEDIQLVVVDYLQLMRGNERSENRQQEISDISSSLKALAKELGVPVLALSQLSRATEQREHKRPQLSDLRESGSIEQDADLVLLLYREEFYKPDNEDTKGLADIIIAKQRNGPTDTIRLSFLKEFTRFENCAIGMQ